MKSSVWYKMTYVGTLFLMIGHFLLTQNSLFLGFGLRSLSTVFLTPYAVLSKQWYLVIIEIVFFTLDFTKFIEILQT
jgi:hypothetical protein